MVEANNDSALKPGAREAFRATVQTVLKKTDSQGTKRPPLFSVEVLSQAEQEAAGSALAEAESLKAAASSIIIPG